MAQDEQVLVVERRVLEDVGTFHGLMFEVDRYLSALFQPENPRYMPRHQAEKDPRFKQLIPYVIMRCGDRYLSYVRGRRAGETRLVGNRSIGIGGHINPVDEMPLFGGDYRDTYLSAVRREVDEEVDVATSHTDRIVALLNDDSNEVGQVHLGVVHLWDLAEPAVSKREQMITQLGFLDREELLAARDGMETWSQLCVDGLGEMTERADRVCPHG